MPYCLSEAKSKNYEQARHREAKPWRSTSTHSWIASLRSQWRSTGFVIASWSRGDPEWYNNWIASLTLAMTVYGICHREAKPWRSSSTHSWIASLRSQWRSTGFVIVRNNLFLLIPYFQTLCTLLSFEQVEAEFPISLIFFESLAIPTWSPLIPKNRKSPMLSVKEESKWLSDMESISRKLTTFSSIPKRPKKAQKCNPLFSLKKSSISRSKSEIILSFSERSRNIFARLVLQERTGSQALLRSLSLLGRSWFLSWDLELLVL